MHGAHQTSLPDSTQEAESVPTLDVINLSSMLEGMALHEHHKNGSSTGQEQVETGQGVTSADGSFFKISSSSCPAWKAMTCHMAVLYRRGLFSRQRAEEYVQVHREALKGEFPKITNVSKILDNPDSYIDATAGLIYRFFHEKSVNVGKS